MTMDIFAFRKQWRMTKARIQATWFWRVFGVRAMQKWWTKFLVAVAIMAGFWSLFSYVQSLNPALPLEQLTKNEGVLVHNVSQLSLTGIVFIGFFHRILLWSCLHTAGITPLPSLR